jgi:hypothetical protein
MKLHRVSKKEKSRDNWVELPSANKTYTYLFTWRQTYLVGGFIPSEKYEFVTWDDDIPN